jgi:hypothetical protein
MTAFTPSTESSQVLTSGGLYRCTIGVSDASKLLAGGWRDAYHYSGIRFELAQNTRLVKSGRVDGEIVIAIRS